MAGIQIMKRDIRVLQSLGKHGVLDTEMIHRLHFSSVTERRCLQRISQYLEHGFIYKTSLRVWYDHGEQGGRMPAIYSLSDRGAQLLEELTGERPLRVSRSSPKPETLFHRLTIVRWRLAFDGAFEREGMAEPAWILEQDVRTDLTERVPPNQRSVLFHRFSVNGVPVCCKPDAASLFSITTAEGNDYPFVFYWEIDRSTEGHEQIRTQKIRSYAELLKSQPYLRYWPEAGQPKLRVVFACPRDSRERRIKALARTIQGTALEPYVRFVSLQHCQSSRLLRDDVWRDAAGRKLRILND
ncbi:MAG: replication-relaxation family protein [Planctomycetaceae bacterium]